jgi:histidyl-tRNA synthetase
VKIEAPRGTLDVLPAEQPLRDAIVGAAESAAERYGYGRIVTPAFESTELFARTSGAGSDVVQKEMYTFSDRAGRSLTLRPEGTAPVARAYLEHGLHREPQPVKTFYVGPMYRYAAPQKGRYREFWQIGFEAMGSDDPALDAELIQLFISIERELGIEGTRLELNSIGDRECRPRYVERLRAFLADRDDELDEDARAKLATTPLRVFDTKTKRVRQALAGAPTIGESLCDACREHFAAVQAYLHAYGVTYELVPTLVRGLDYYTRTVWEFQNDALGAAQSSICAGGRYDYLGEEIGGPPTPGVGWAAGIERIGMSVSKEVERPPVDVFFVCGDGADRPAVLAQMADLRRAGLRCDADYAGRSLKGQMTQAGRLRARTVVQVAGDEATIREGGAERARGVPVAAIARELVGHPDPPPAFERTDEERARGARTVPKEERRQ